MVCLVVVVVQRWESVSVGGHASSCSESLGLSCMRISCGGTDWLWHGSNVAGTWMAVVWWHCTGYEDMTAIQRGGLEGVSAAAQVNSASRSASGGNSASFRCGCSRGSDDESLLSSLGGSQQVQAMACMACVRCCVSMLATCGGGLGPHSLYRAVLHQGVLLLCVLACTRCWRWLQRWRQGGCMEA